MSSPFWIGLLGGKSCSFPKRGKVANSNARAIRAQIAISEMTYKKRLEIRLHSEKEL